MLCNKGARFDIVLQFSVIYFQERALQLVVQEGHLVYLQVDTILKHGRAAITGFGSIRTSVCVDRVIWCHQIGPKRNPTDREIVSGRINMYESTKNPSYSTKASEPNLTCPTITNKIQYLKKSVGFLFSPFLFWAHLYRPVLLI